MASFSRPIAKRARSSRVATTADTDRLRVMISKSANFTLSVTVRPRVPVDSQCRQTLSINGWSSHHRAEFSEVGRERVLGADRFADAIGPDGAVVDAARNPVVIGTGFAEILLQEGEELIANVEAGPNSERVEFSGSCRSDAVKLSDRQLPDESRSHLRWDDVLPVRFAMIGGELRQELVIGNARRGVQACFSFDLLSDPQRDVSGQQNALQIFGDIEVGLIERKRLDNRRVLGEDLANLSLACPVA